MGYSRSLDEYREDALLAELALRRSRRQQGVCDYCARKPDTSPCRFPERHRAAAEPARRSAVGL
jgi:hypothetical protein